MEHGVRKPRDRKEGEEFGEPGGLPPEILLASKWKEARTENVDSVAMVGVARALQREGEDGELLGERGGVATVEFDPKGGSVVGVSL